MNYEKAHLTHISRPTLELSLYKDPNRLFKKFQELKNIKLSSVPGGRTSPRRNVPFSNAKNAQKFSLLAELTKSPRHKVSIHNHSHNTSSSTLVNKNSAKTTNNTTTTNTNANNNASLSKGHNIYTYTSNGGEKKVVLKSAMRKNTDPSTIATSAGGSANINSKSRIYTSFLEHKSGNPFESPLNMLTKSNPNFYMGLAKENGLVDASINSRFDKGGNSSYMNLVDYSLDSRILNKLLVSQSVINTNNTTSNGDQQQTQPQQNTAVTDNKLTNSSSKFSTNLFINFRKNDDKLLLKKPFLEKTHTMPVTTTNTSTNVVANNTNSSSNINNNTTNAKFSGRSKGKTRSSSAVKRSAVLPENNSIKSPSFVLNNNNYSTNPTTVSTSNPINSNNNNNNNNTISNNNKKKEMAEITCRVYTDEAKYIFIKTWLDEVERVHAIEGKYLETINKITFYD